MSRTDDIAPGTRFGPYLLVEPLGRGSSATVYLAHDDQGNAVALKVRKRGVASLDRRFLREFESMRTLRLPGVVRVFEVGVHDELLWFSMELVGGRTILEVIHEEKVIADRVRRTLDLGRQLLDILAAIHEVGFVHRDIKPSNVLVDKRGQVHVLDFGIVRATSDGDTLSSSGQILGTVPFMAPEQLAGHTVDQTVDLFATGLMLYEAIAGQRPRPQTTVGWIPRICLERLVPLACQYKDVPRGLSALVEELTRVDPGRRPSAAECGRRLAALAAGQDTADWPEPPFVEPGGWWTALEGCLPTRAAKPSAWIVEGPSGSGRRRVAEQLHRNAVIQGTWPLHVTCRVDDVGSPLRQLMEALLGKREDDEWLASVVADEAGVLRHIWPHLPLPSSEHEGPPPTPAGVADCVARCIQRAAQHRSLLVVVHRLERVDSITARALAQLASAAGESFGLLMLHDPRWGSADSARLVADLRARAHTGYREVQPLDAEAATAIAASLCPKAPPRSAPAGSPLQAVEVGLRALAAWRGETWTPPGEHLWPLVIRELPVPAEVMTRAGGPGAVDDPWVSWTDEGVRLEGAFARTAVAARLDDLRGAAGRLAEAWTDALGGGASMGDIAALRLLAGDPTGAWEPAAHAALRAESQGRHAVARRWLLLLDGLPADRVSAGHLAFELAHARARVALTTEVGSPDLALVEVCERYASSPDKAQLAQVLRAEYLRRAGKITPALVQTLRVASPSRDPDPAIAARALMVATRCRISLDQLEQAAQQLDRADSLLAEHPDRIAEVDAAVLRAELHYLDGRLEACRRLSRETIRLASERGYIRGVARASARLGAVLRMLGRRREAEHHLRAAREAIGAIGDLTLDAEAGLALATLLSERGDAASAHNLLDDTVRRIRGLRMDRLLSSAMRVALQIATVQADTTDAAMALVGLRECPVPDPEAPAAQVRWWRTRADVRRALSIEAPPEGTYGRVLWLLERSRAALGDGQLDQATDEARAALALAERRALGELATYARLLLGVMGADDPANWPKILRLASSSLYTEVYLGALELDARRLYERGDIDGSLMKWRVLRARAQEIGYRPAVEDATGWMERIASPQADPGGGDWQ